MSRMDEPLAALNMQKVFNAIIQSDEKNDLLLLCHEDTTPSIRTIVLDKQNEK